MDLHDTESIEQVQPLIALDVDGPEHVVAALDHTDTDYLNRELSWLSFNARVLAMAATDGVPLLERVRFLAIYTSNLDEFFQVRMGGLGDQVAASVRLRTPDGRSPQEQVDAIRLAVEALERHRQAIFVDRVGPELQSIGLHIRPYGDLDDLDRKVADEYFDEHVYPILTPLAIDPGHPFPYISDLSLNLGVCLLQPDDERRRFARVKIPNTVSRLVPLASAGVFTKIEDVVAAHLDRLFPGHEVVEHVTFRVTRNADLNYRDEEADDLLELVEMELRRRRFGNAVRIEIDRTSAVSVIELLHSELDIGDSETYLDTGFLAMVDLMELVDLDRPELKFAEVAPVVPARLASVDGNDVDFFAELRLGDILVHHPYESFTSSVQEFIRQAAEDPDVVAIKMTLYRTSSDSPIVQSLVHAVESGKQVAVLIELRARFDERANIEWARTLEQEGVHVTYGLAGLKVHSKVVMVVRREGSRLVRYCHFGTGNYNEGTARLYCDFGLFTASPSLGDEVGLLFNTLTGYGHGVDYDGVLVAPGNMRAGLIDLIRAEMESENGWIILKMNSLVDPELIGLLYEAGRAGVQVDLIVRGICGLRPGVPGLSENIRVRSIIGKYLEHARIYFFANGRGAGRSLTYIGSADLMPRNLDHRVEVLVAIDDPKVEEQLLEAIEIDLTPSIQAWDLEADGSWHRMTGDGLIDIHARFELEAVRRRTEKPA